MREQLSPEVWKTRRVVCVEDVLPCGCGATRLVPARRQLGGHWEPVAKVTEVDVTRGMATLEGWERSFTGEMRKTTAFVDGVHLFCQHGEVVDVLAAHSRGESFT